MGVPGAPPAGELPGDAARWVRRVSDDLRYLDPESGQKRQKPRPAGTTVVVAGDRQPAAVHLLAHAINHHLGNVGKTVFHTAPLAARPVDHAASLAELADDMDRGLVEVLVIVGGNPVYTAPADLRFAERMRKVPLRFHLSLHQDETSRLCQWHLPEAHYLESWGDTRAFDGTASIVQPLIEPLYEGRSAHELMTVLAGGREAPPVEIVRAYWAAHRPALGSAAAGDFDDFWQTAVHDGVVPGTAYPLRSVSLKEGWEKHLGPGAAPAEGTELVFQAGPDDLRRPFRQQRLAPGTSQADHASHLGQRRSHESEDGEGVGRRPGRLRPRRRTRRLPSTVVELQLGERTVTAPVWIMPGHADGSVTVYLGGGRRNAGKVGDGVGFNAYALRTTDRPWFAGGLKVSKTGQTHLLCCVQEHHLMENREVVRAGTLGRVPRTARLRRRQGPGRREEGHAKGAEAAHPVQRVPL